MMICNLIFLPFNALEIEIVFVINESLVFFVNVFKNRRFIELFLTVLPTFLIYFPRLGILASLCSPG